MLDSLRAICLIEKSDIYRCVGVSFVEGVLMAAPYFLLVAFFQQLLADQISYTNIYILLLLLLLLLSARIVVTRFSMVDTTSLSYSSCSQLRLRVADHLFRVPMHFFSRYSTSDISYRMNRDIAFTENIFAHFFSQFVGCITVVTLLSTLFFWMDWRLALCLLLGVPLSVVAQAFLKRGANHLSAEMHKEMNKTNTAVMDWVQGIREHKLSGNDRQSLDVLQQRIQHTQKIALKHELRVGFVPILFSILPEMGFGVFIICSLWLYGNSQLSLALFAIFLIASTRLYLCLGQLAVVMAESRFMEQASLRVKSLINHKTLVVGNSDHELSGDVWVNDLSFGYPLVAGSSLTDGGTQKTILNNVNFVARAGSLTAIVGASGVGKTTLLHLLARYYQVGDQSIRLDEYGINEFSDGHLYRQLALVSQDIQLFDTTIMENLLMVRKNLTEQDVYRACQQARCDQFIRRLPGGYYSQAGEAGAYLSGGEKQRLAMARALLLDAKILLLDEITSALDVKNERYILQLIGKLKKDKTLIMITHRESLAASADQVLMLRYRNQPLIGQHDQLLQKNTEYRELWNNIC